VAIRDDGRHICPPKTIATASPDPRTEPADPRSYDDAIAGEIYRLHIPYWTRFALSTGPKIIIGRFAQIRFLGTASLQVANNLRCKRPKLNDDCKANMSPFREITIAERVSSRFRTTIEPLATAAKSATQICATTAHAVLEREFQSRQEMSPNLDGNKHRSSDRLRGKR
jgi:hypothetical protein